ncbi:hypothetical protein FQA39_LY01697 [Lamprigera yunnana]|nr:hypothetical protein FQA39_LY01697 [Lamprigera yunnana]
MFSIEGKVALVTGGASGIGLHCVKELLNNGAKGVTIADINKETGMEALKDLRKEYGEDKVIFDEIDVSNKHQFEECFKKTIQKFNNVDILINSAGVYNEIPWEQEVAVNLNGTINGTLLAIQNYIHKYKSGVEGVIVNLSSILGIDVAESTPIYSATKHAVTGLTRSFGTQLHYELSNVRIFAVCPGYTDTPLLKSKEQILLNINYDKNFIKNQHLLVLLQPSEVAKHLVGLIPTAPQGSVWLIEDKQPVHEVEYVPRTAFAKIMQ